MAHPDQDIPHQALDNLLLRLLVADHRPVSLLLLEGQRWPDMTVLDLLDEAVGHMQDSPQLEGLHSWLLEEVVDRLLPHCLQRQTHMPVPRSDAFSGQQLRV